MRTKAGTLLPNRGIKNIKDELLSTTASIVIQVKRNSAFLSPSFLTERRFGDLYMEGHLDQNMNQCFYTGAVLGDNKSSVTLNVCEGLVRNSFFLSFFFVSCLILYRVQVGLTNADCQHDDMTAFFGNSPCQKVMRTKLFLRICSLSSYSSKLSFDILGYSRDDFILPEKIT